MTTACQVIETHPNYREIRYNKAMVGFIDNQTKKKLKGITDGLDECFWPDYQLQVVPISAKERLESQFTFGRELEAYGPTGGLKRGTTVHRELKTYADMMRASDEEYERYKEKCMKKPLTEWSLMVIKALEGDPSKLQLHIKFSELCVGDRENGLATAIDLVCLDQNGGWRLVELKTGYAHAFISSCGHMLRLGDKVISDCPLNQAKIQLAISAVLFQKTFPDIPISGYHILNVNRTGTHMYHVDNSTDEIIPYRHEIYQSFLQWRAEKKREKEEAKKRSKKKQDGSTSRKRVSRSSRKKEEDTTASEQNDKKKRTVKHRSG